MAAPLTIWKNWYSGEGAIEIILRPKTPHHSTKANRCGWSSRTPKRLLFSTRREKSLTKRLVRGPTWYKHLIQIRQNRLHLRQQSLHPYREGSKTPGATSLLPTGGHGEQAMTILPTDEIIVEGGSGKTKTSLPMTESSDTSTFVHHIPMQSQNSYITRSDCEITPPPPPPPPPPQKKKKKKKKYM